MLKHGLLIAVVASAMGCGSPKSDNPSPIDEPKPIKNVPKALTLSGGWATPPHFQLREIGKSRLLQLDAKVAVRDVPHIDRLTRMMDISRAAQLTWVAPILGSCKLDQQSIKGVLEDDIYSIQFVLWGWDKEQAQDCETFLQQARDKGIQIVLTDVPVYKSKAVESVNVILKPAP